MSMAFTGPVPVPPPQSSGLVVLVTGASRGLGRELVVQYARASTANVLFAGVRDPASAGARALTELGLKNVHVIKLDVTREDSVRASVGSVKAVADHLDVLINNAGIGGTADGFDPTTATVEVFSTVFATNVTGVMLTTQAYLPLLKRSTTDGGARVINMSSAMGSNQYVNAMGTPSTSYGTSKAALNYLTNAFRYKVPEIAFLAIHPGWVDTEGGRFGGGAPPTKTEDSVQAMRYYIATKTVKNSGEYLDVPSGQLIPY